MELEPLEPQPCVSRSAHAHQPNTAKLGFHLNLCIPLASMFSEDLRLAGTLELLVDFYLITRDQPISFVGHADDRH